MTSNNSFKPTPLRGGLIQALGHAMRVTWRELAIDLSSQSSDELLEEWRWLAPNLTLRMVSALGDAFLQDSHGAIYWLDTATPTITRIADSREHFDDLRQQPQNADEWFIPQLVGDLLISGKSLGVGECFSYKIPPSLGGAFSPDNFEPCDLAVHFSTLGQIQRQVHDLQPGTPIKSIKLST